MCRTKTLKGLRLGCPVYYDLHLRLSPPPQDSLCFWIKALPSGLPYEVDTITLDLAHCEDCAIHRSVERLMGLARAERFAGAFAEIPCDTLLFQSSPDQVACLS